MAGFSFAVDVRPRQVFHVPKGRAVWTFTEKAHRAVCATLTLTLLGRDTVSPAPFNGLRVAGARGPAVPLRSSLTVFWDADPLLIPAGKIEHGDRVPFLCALPEQLRAVSELFFPFPGAAGDTLPVHIHDPKVKIGKRVTGRRSSLERPSSQFKLSLLSIAGPQQIHSSDVTS